MSKPAKKGSAGRAAASVHDPRPSPKVASIPPHVPELSSRTSAVLRLVVLERVRQEQLVRDRVHPFNCADGLQEHITKLPILMEEVGEVAKEVYEHAIFESDEEDPFIKLRAELTQVAAVAVAWLESLEP